MALQELFPSSMMEYINMVHPCAGNQRCWEFMRKTTVSGPEYSVSQHPFPSLALTSSCPSSEMFPEPWRGWYRYSIKHWALNNHSFSAIWPVMSLCVNCFHCTQENLWPRLRAALICVYKHKYIENSLIPCTVSETTVVHSPLEPRSSLAFGFWPDLQY